MSVADRPGDLRACFRKVAYDLRALALAQAVIRMGAGAPVLRAYECPWCRKWHLTHKKESE